MKLNHFSTVFCACALGSTFLASGSATAQTCVEVTPAIYNETFEIGLQVDSSRHVQRALFSNNSAGDYILEFMASRTDISASRERWTVTYENDEDFDFVRHLAIDGVWAHSLTVRTIQGVQHIVIAIPGATAQITPNTEPCDPEFQIFASLVDEISNQRTVISVVIEQVVQNPPWLECVEQCKDGAFCGDPPNCWVFSSPHDVSDCVNGLVCCTGQGVPWADCFTDCACMLCTNTAEEKEDCCAWAESMKQVHKDACVSSFIDCISHATVPVPCP